MYTYRCGKGHTHEYYLKLAEHTPLRCETCDSQGLERVLDGQTFSPRTSTRPIHHKPGSNYSPPLVILDISVVKNL